jgi:N-acetylglutamate synthase-like GNAT family acetyltransferase
LKIIDLQPEHESLYFCCLEDWSDEMKEAGNHKENWFNCFKHKGLRVKLAKDDSGNIGGMIQYLPIEHSFFEGEDLYVVLCIWVHGYKQGRGDFRKLGMGKALIQAAEDDAKLLGAKGLVTWGIIMPFYMRASWFKKRGYKTVDKQGIMRLLWKPFTADVKPPKIVKRIKKPISKHGVVNVTSFKNGWCPAQNLANERAKRALEEIKGQTEFTEIDTSDKKVLHEWGIVDGLFVDGREISLGPPPSYTKIKRKIERRVKRLKNV